ncbi:MAG TPA: thioredoxin domain-containing protein [Gemmatimonadaceae bacterium]|nr:thioredoxin domain-containing protein [Gemmatimonadaceae bacterium]
MPNRLATESSPYLRQHAENPVDWYPWGEAALARARAEDRPILLSVGYAACHWCHVMAHESFEDPATAAVMNEHFVNVKVDREERPDVDAIYMQAVQAMTGHGGWPMTVFLTPAGEPFYAGTYFPPEDRHGMPSFTRVLRSVAEAYRTQRDRVAQTAAAVRELYERQAAPSRASGQVTAQTLERAYRQIVAQYDPEHGGFGGAPKFPQAMALDFVLRHWRRTGTAGALDVVRHSFRAMARGGIYDQVGGGFHRYSVDAHWLVPHFEKMLYDNALLARLGVHLWQATGDLESRRIAEETLDWVAREMTSPDGGFYSSLDADSEGEEGRFYLWDAAELDALLGEDAAIARAYWGVSAAGNFEGRNILHVPNPPDAVAGRLGIDVERLALAIARARPRLYEARAQRVWPGRDEKILAGWNGLTIRAAAEAARAFGRGDYAALARRAGELLRDRMVRDDGRVWRVYAVGTAKIDGMLEDHAAAALAFLSLHELTFDRSWLALAERVAGAMVEAFWDDAAGHFYDTARDAESLVTRPREVTDNAMPSGTSLAVELLLVLGELRHDADLTRRASWVLETLAEPMARYGSAFGHLLGAADLAVRGAVEVALVGEPAAADFQALSATVGAHYLPGLVLAGGPPADGEDAVALLAGRPMLDGRATAYVCRHYACAAPTTEPAVLAEQLAAAPRVSPDSAPT